jgi:integrase
VAFIARLKLSTTKCDGMWEKQHCKTSIHHGVLLSPSDEATDSPIPAVKPSKKGIATHPKWHLTNEQLTQLLPELHSARDKAMVLVGAYVGYRISELLSWTLADVLDADGCIRDVVTVESKRLKGGRHIPKAPARPEGHPVVVPYLSPALDNEEVSTSDTGRVLSDF